MENDPMSKSRKSKVRRGVTEQTANQRKAIMAFMQDCAVSSYDVGKYMGFNKVKTNNTLRGMEKDGLIVQDGVADAHPTGQGRPPYLWRLTDDTYWKKIHGVAGSEEDNERESSPVDEKKVVPTPPEDEKAKAANDEEVDEETVADLPDEKTASTHEEAANDSDIDTPDDAKEEVKEKVKATIGTHRETQSEADTVLASTNRPSRPKSPRTASPDSVTTVIVFTDNKWVVANSKNILEYCEALRDGDATTLDIPRTYKDIGTYIEKHQDVLVF